MSTFEFKTPVTDEDIKKVHIGDVIYLTGNIVTGRDDVHHRVVIGGKEPPVDLKGKAIFHAGPIMKKISAEGEPDKFKVISVGPTTSMRMEKAQAEFLEKTGVKIIIGKGGMGPKTTKGCVDNCAIHTIFPGGCAVVAAEEVIDCEGVEWLDLGMPEAMWKLKCERFGPLIVSIDSYGNNLIENNKVDFNAKREKALEDLKGKLSYME
ncbi:L(+)-tartrate dehydratase beta subunit [Ruminococcaceae bacterium R-25]|nr:L(+)-tartrate dehydratase beta subunit [Ruminococcaceae bacterium R-25]SUQ22269.1 L(+)-tartrate dehydratase beta subunit [Oscillospiraceae bacterium]